MGRSIIRKKVLIACERSGAVRRAFRKLGHDAYSCDIEPADDKDKHHIQGDVLDHLDRWASSYDLMIAHPPCTYLCNSGVSWLHRWPDGMRGWNGARAADMVKAVRFFKVLLNANIPRIAVENPIPHRHALLPKYTQIIQPWMFGHPESKATCLWLKNLPKLTPTDDVKHIWKNLPKAQAQRLHYLPPSKERARLRSQTYEGIAKAMAEQWGK